MKLSLRTFLLAGLSATLALPAAGQDVQPQPVQPAPGGDAGQVTAIPTGRVLTLPAAPVSPEVMQWPVQHAQSLLTVAEGIGTGATEAEVRAAVTGFREAPHEYSEAPAKYLTAPGAERGDPALRFEIGADGKVSLVHVGTMPVLGYVEGCA